jgi:ABC-type Zn uptake system ZnuABC Zn-binding protein ZnuA
VTPEARQPWFGPRAIAASSLLVSGLFAAGCAAPVPSLPRVAATISPLADIVREIAGSSVAVIRILPAGVSPHTFEPSPGTARDLTRTRTIFAIGHGLDDWVVTLAAASGVSRVVRADAGLPLRPVAHRDNSRDGGELVDPHYWLSCANAKKIAETVERELASLFPDQAGAFASRRASYAARLDSLDAEIRSTLAHLPNRDIATFHDAFEYFAADYGLRVVAVFEPYPGREPGPRFVRDFERKVRQSEVRAVFAEPQLSVDLLKPITQDLGVSLSVLDPLGGVPGRESFVDMMRFNAGQLARSLGGR